ncbi:hypothetical protein D3C85_1059930 [compost metagenome]
MEARRAETRHHGARSTTAAPGGGRPTIGNAKITEQLVGRMTEALRPARKDRMSCAMLPHRQKTPLHEQRQSTGIAFARHCQVQTKSSTVPAHLKRPNGKLLYMLGELSYSTVRVIRLCLGYLSAAPLIPVPAQAWVSKISLWVSQPWWAEPLLYSRQCFSECWNTALC